MAQLQVVLFLLIDWLYFTASGLHNNADNNLSSLQIFLEFVEREDLYDIITPTANNMKGEGGFRINSNDERLTPKVRKCLYKCTRTFVSTVDNKSVRVRFLGKENLGQSQKIQAVVTKSYWIVVFVHSEQVA